jgi:hypothetical protein
LARSRAGERLCRAAGPHARSRGAGHLYVPATPSQRTTDFHRRPVLRSANPRLDPAPDALEPNDIHLDELTH